MAAAPLPSPSANQPTCYFAPPFPPTSSPLTQQQPQHYSNPACSSLQPTSQLASIQSSHHHHRQAQPSAFPQRGGATNDPSSATSPFLRDFKLVAEAAKRAQMAVLMRDMEGVAL